MNDNSYPRQAEEKQKENERCSWMTSNLGKISNVQSMRLKYGCLSDRIRHGHDAFTRRPLNRWHLDYVQILISTIADNFDDIDPLQIEKALGSISKVEFVLK